MGAYLQRAGGWMVARTVVGADGEPVAPNRTFSAPSGRGWEEAVWGKAGTSRGMGGMGDSPRVSALRRIRELCNLWTRKLAQARCNTGPSSKTFFTVSIANTLSLSFCERAA